MNVLRRIAMPYSFNEGKSYKINYSDFKFDLANGVRGKLFDSELMDKKYIDSWIAHLKNGEKNPLDRFFENLVRYESISSKHRIFTQIVNIGKQKVIIHFNAELMAAIVKNYAGGYEEISYERFIGTPPDYLWTPPNDGENSKSNSPILVVPYKDAGALYLVIDGNHRVVEATERKEYISVKYINVSDDKTRNTLFTSLFDELFYCFYFELACLLTYKEQNPKMSDKELFYKSFLSGATINFDFEIRN